MVWTGGGGNRLAVSLATLFDQLAERWPGEEWQRSPQSGTIGDPTHFAEGSASDHNPWLNHTVRALDVAQDTDGSQNGVPVHDAPPGELLEQMFNGMYAARDPRVFPDGYFIRNRRITDPSRPGQMQAYFGDDPHVLHNHISVSTDPTGYDSADPWPLPGTSPRPVGDEDDMFLVTDTDAGPELTLLIAGGDVFLLGPGQLAAYRELGVSEKHISPSGYAALRARGRNLS